MPDKPHTVTVTERVLARLMVERDEAVTKVEELKGERDLAYANQYAAEEETAHLRVALRQILDDPDATILDSHRDDGWAALR